MTTIARLAKIEVEIPEPTVLILDDDPYFSEATKNYLESLGAAVTVASTVSQGIELLGKKPYDALIVDVMFENSSQQGDQFILDNANLLKGAQVFAVTGNIAALARSRELYENDVRIVEKGDAKFPRFLKGVIQDSVEQSQNRLKAAMENMIRDLERWEPGSVTFATEELRLTARDFRNEIAAPTVKASEERLKADRLQVFLCHSSGDRSAVQALYHRLLEDGTDPWLDKEALLPGQEWKLEIKKAVRYSDIVIICLSEEAVNKTGYVQNEIRIALEVANQKPEGDIFIIPLRLEVCEVPDRLNRWHRVDLFEENGYEKLLRSLRSHATKLKAKKSSDVRG